VETGFKMNKRRVLVAWIGHSDLKAMAASWKNSAGAAILAELGGAQPTAREIGPIKALVDAEPFDEIRLLSDFRPAWNKANAQLSGFAARIRAVPEGASSKAIAHRVYFSRRPAARPALGRD